MKTSNCVRAIVAGSLVALWVSPSVAGRICPGPIGPGPTVPGPTVPGPTDPQPSHPFPLMGTEYQISGLNSRLPEPKRPTTVKFDGVPERVGSYMVNESMQQVVKDNGDTETWMDIEFTRIPEIILDRTMQTSPLAEDVQQSWRAALSDFQLTKGMKFPESYMYFTQDGTPAPFGGRRPRGGGEYGIGEHPFLSDVNVWREATKPVDIIDLPPGAKNGLVTQFEHYFSAVHDVGRGMGVPTGVNGFHLGYRVVTVPEPATCVLGMFAAVGNAWMLRRRRHAVASLTAK